MGILQVSGLTHGFLDKNLYENAEFEIYPGEHVGIVGQNGVGKSTLLKIITGELPPDRGEIKWGKDLKLGFLDQHAEIPLELTITDYLRGAYREMFEAEQKMEALFQEAAERNDMKRMERASRIQERLLKDNFYAVESEIGGIAAGLGLIPIGMDKKLGELSGGQRAKVIVAKLLLEKPDVLVMDEPTNFFDKEHVSWLTSYLKEFKGAFLTVSHNYDFLESITNRILNIEFGQIRKYYGKYSEFLKQKDALAEDYIRRYDAQQKVIEKTEEYIRRNIAGVNSKNARGRRKQLERMERLTPPGNLSKPTVSFTEVPIETHDTLIVKDLKVGYRFPLLPPISFRVQNGEIVVITGFNGLGKSTLLKTLVREIEAISGSFRFAPLSKIAYYEQELRWESKDATPLSVVRNWFPKLSDKEIRKILSRVNLKNEHITQAVGTLSGGEQSKVKLVKLMQTPANFLILDEPTNHFDAETKEAFQEALSEYKGSVLLVSHEEAFYRDLADRIFDISDFKTKK